MTLTTSGPITAGNVTIRRQHIESKQRRHDELRDGYRRVKDNIHRGSNHELSKVFLPDPLPPTSSTLR